MGYTIRSIFVVYPRFFPVLRSWPASRQLSLWSRFGVRVEDSYNGDCLSAIFRMCITVCTLADSASHVVLVSHPQPYMAVAIDWL